MATVTKTIGTSSRDYSDIDAWEADLDSDSIYSDGDTAIGECYADSTFSDVAYLIEQGTTIGGSAGYDLALIKLTVHADSRHDGTAGTGALLKSTANGTHNYGVLRINVDNVTVEWLEIDMDHDGDITTEDSDSRDMNKGIVLTGTNDDCIIRNMLIHGKYGNPGNTGPMGIHVTGAGASSDTLTIQNNIIYNLIETGGDTAQGVNTNQWAGTANLYNNTLYNIDAQGTSKQAWGLVYGNVASAVVNVKNNLVAKIVADGDADHERGYQKSNGSSTENASNNLSDDTVTDSTYKAPGSNSLQDKTLAEIAFVSTVANSEDLRLAQLSSSNVPSVCRDAGVDLGTTNGVNIDIAGRDRDAAGDTWDIGAHEQVYISTPFIGFVE